MKRGFFTRLAACAAAAAAVMVAAGTQAGAAEAPAPGAAGKIKVGLVFDVGGLGDKSFNDSANAGLTRAIKELGVTGQYREPGEGSQRADHLRNFARGDADLMIGVGFLFTDTITQAATDFPKKKFACVDYSVGDPADLPPNLAALTFREEEGSFLVGALAALKSKSGKIGFVGGVESPLIKKFEAGYTQGAKQAVPKIEVRVAYAGVTDKAFANPTKGKELATSMYEQGVDIIFHASGSTGLGVFRAAEEKGAMAIGVDADQAKDAKPGVVLTSMLKNTDAAVFDTVRAAAEGRFKGGVTALGLKEGGVGYVYDDKNKALIGDDIRAKVEALKSKIIAGEIKVVATVKK